MKHTLTKLIIVFLLFSSLWSNDLKAQYDPMFTQYMNNEMFINPAYAGSKEALAVTLLNRQQWVGFSGRPITSTFSIHTPIIQNKVGIGLSFLNEKIGVLNRNIIYGSYAYRFKTGTRSILSLGLMGGVHMQLNKLGEITPTDMGDPVFANNTPLVVTPNFGFGMYYNTDKFYVSLSIPRILDDHLTFNSEGKLIKGINYDIKSWHYYLALGRVFNVNDNVKLKPQMMMKSTVDAPVEFDVNLNALFFEKIWLGAGYRSKADISALVGVQLCPNFLISYSYDYQTTAIQKYSGGSHEIVASYVFGYNGKKVITPRYF